MSFAKKSLHQSNRNISFLKGASLFFLGMTCVLFATKAFEISPVATNAVMYMKTIFLTASGTANSATGITLDGVDGDAYFKGKVGIGTPAGSDQLRVTGSVRLFNDLTVNGATTINGNIGIGTTSPTEKMDVRGNAKFSATIQINTSGSGRCSTTSDVGKMTYYVACVTSGEDTIRTPVFAGCINSGSSASISTAFLTGTSRIDTEERCGTRDLGLPNIVGGIVQQQEEGGFESME